MTISFIIGWIGHSLYMRGWPTKAIPLGKSQPSIEKAYKVVPFVRVVDGDTIKVMWEGAEVSVRMLRINTPERGQSGYGEATEYLRSLIGNAQSVALDFENPEKAERDRYGRLLCYVWLKAKNLNVEMVREGHSTFWIKYGEGKYAKEFKEAERAQVDRPSQ